MGRYPPTASQKLRNAAGRSLNACKSVYLDMSTGASRLTSYLPQLQAAPNRSYPSGVSTSVPGRMIQPRPTSTLNDILNASPSEEPPRKKKRGRPTKAEALLKREAADAAAAARSGAIPQTRQGNEMQASASMCTDTESSGISAIMGATLRQAVGTPPPLQSTPVSEASSGKRKRGRPSKSDTAARRLEETAKAAVDCDSPSRERHGRAVRDSQSGLSAHLAGDDPYLRTSPGTLGAPQSTPYSTHPDSHETI
ncbi:hypothetical protein LTR50_002605 [Elasticomyces elasticus]|nr:hypothetical protein LTR50_002605 [Elasticomyces elasticus]